MHFSKLGLITFSTDELSATSLRAAHPPYIAVSAFVTYSHIIRLFLGIAMRRTLTSLIVVVSFALPGCAAIRSNAGAHMADPDAFHMASVFRVASDESMTRNCNASPSDNSALCLNPSAPEVAGFITGATLEFETVGQIASLYRLRSNQTCREFMRTMSLRNSGVRSTASLVTQVGIIGSTLFSDRGASGIAGGIALLANTMQTSGAGTISSMNAPYSGYTPDAVASTRRQIWQEFQIRMEMLEREHVTEENSRVPTRGLLEYLERYHWACSLLGAQV